MKKDGLDKLSQLLGGATPSPGRPQAQTPPPAASNADEDIVEDANKVLDFVRGLVGDNIFDAQVLIEFVAAELIAQIREMAEEP